MPDTPAPKRRWYRITPERLVLVLFAFEALVLVAEWRCWWPSYGGKGWNALIGVAGVGVVILLLSGWLVASVAFRRQFQYSLRSLLLLVVAVAIPFSWLATEMQRAARQRDFVASLAPTGGSADYDYWYGGDRHAPFPEKWLEALFGKDFFAEVHGVSVRSDAGLASIREWSPLQGVDLLGPGITDTGLKSLRRFKQIRLLQFTCTAVTDEGLRSLVDIDGIRTLCLSDAKVGDSGMAYVGQMRLLRNLILSGTNVSDAGLRHLTGLDELEVLDLSCTRITGEGIAWLKECRRIRYLALTQTDITDGALIHLQGMANIECLDLSRTNITDAGSVYLKRLTRLRTLDVRDTRIGGKATKMLREALPQCSITNWRSPPPPPPGAIQGRGMMPPPPLPD
jgi:hypothetical protein